jgi:CDGSH-type Zn-finger protein
MSAEELVQFFSTLGAGGKKIGGVHDNFGVGAKVASLPWNPEGIVVVSYKGPYFVRGALQIDGAAADMPGVAFRAALCRCGASNNKPFCDNSHETAGFDDYGAVGESTEGGNLPVGGLSIKRAKDGPLLLNGPVTIVTSSGRAAWRGDKAALCRCGASNNKPFCDGSHKAAGFRAD